jgi:hypothetical protein
LKTSIENAVLSLLIFNGIVFTIQDVFGINTHTRFLILAVALILAFIAIYFTGKTTQINALLGLSFLGSEIFLFALPVLFLPKFISFFFVKNVRIKKLQFIVCGFLIYAIALIVVTSVTDFSILNTLLWFLIFGAYLFFFVYYARFEYNETDASVIFGFFFKLIILQLLVVLLQFPIHRDLHPGDSWTGTSGNSVVVGFFLFLLLIYKLVPRIIKPDKTDKLFTKQNIQLLVIIGVVLYLNDSKMIILSFLVAVILYILNVLLLRFLTKFRIGQFYKVVVATVFLILAYKGILFMANVYGQIKYSATGGINTVLREYFNPRLGETGTNAKFILYKRIYSDCLDDSPLVWLFGVGPGKFGSKASNIMAYDILYKDESQVRLPSFIPPYSNYWTRKYMSDLWTKEIALTSRFRSATLSFPFAGLITIKGEFGFIGLLLFLGVTYAFSYYLLRKAYALEHPKFRKWAIVLSIFWFALPVHMIFDNFQEKTYIMLPMLLTSAVLYSLNNKRILTS